MKIWTVIRGMAWRMTYRGIMFPISVAKGPIVFVLYSRVLAWRRQSGTMVGVAISARRIWGLGADAR